MSLEDDLLYRCHDFDALTTERLYQILKIRQKVFVVEQECAYLDCDGYDQMAHHLCGFDSKGEIISYARLLPPESKYERYASFGRILVAEAYRGRGLGQHITAQTIDRCQQLFGNVPIQIMAQSYLISFYRSFGFETKGDRFLEDGIEHQLMVNDLS